MKKLIAVLLAALMAVMTPIGNAATILVNEQPKTRDAPFISAEPTVNLGKYTSLLAGSTPDFTTSSVMWFDLSAASGTVTGASITLTVITAMTDLSKLQLSLIIPKGTQPMWSENTITKPILDAGFTTQSLSITPALVGTKLTLSILPSALQAMVDNPSLNFGLLLGSSQVSATGPTWEFESNDSPTDSLRPVAKLDYNVVPEPSCAMLLLIGIAGLTLRRKRKLAA